MRAAQDEQSRFAAMFDDLSTRVYAYARRHCDAAAAQDVVSETFLVAWRRRADVDDISLPWLLVVARNTMANRHRSERRHHDLTDTIARLDQVAAPAYGIDDSIIERETMLAALAELSELERDALLLVAWDGLTNREAAGVAGCSVRAFEVRLSRARARLARAMTYTPDLRKAT